MTSVFQSLPLLRRVAPRLSKQLFTCQVPRNGLARSPSGRKSLPPSHFLRAFRSGSFPRSAANISATAQSPSPLSSLGREFASSQNAHGRYFPQISSKAAAYWLLASAASVYGIVVFGGLTRLTESGLSITEWRPVTGSLPPRNAEDWDSEFAKYKNSPEFRLLNPKMTLDEFKSIYYMEWTHRLWGRFVGLSFVLPAVYFVARRRVSQRMAVKLVGIAGLIGFQGFLGWWMVKSGLKDDLFAPGSHPRVSQYRLTAHLATAFVCYTAMLWNGLAILTEHKIMADPVTAKKTHSLLASSELKIFRRSVAGLALLVFITAMSGGLVAGLDAGMIYNEFPYMGEGLTPPKAELFSDTYSHRADRSDLWWRNMLENPSLVQLDHRILATTTFTSIVGLWAYTRLSPTMKRMLPAMCKRGVHGVMGFAFLQVTLGITTLLYLVPTYVASAHQAGSLALLSMVIILGGRTWVPRRASRLVAQRLAMRPSTGSTLSRPLTL